METLALASVGENTQKNYLGKWNIWMKERSAQGKGPWLHTLANQEQVMAEVLGVHGVSLSRAQHPTVHGNGVVGADQLFSQHVRGLGIVHLALHDRGRSKRDRQRARDGHEEDPHRVAFDLVRVASRETRSYSHGGRGLSPVAGPGTVEFLVVQSVRNVGLRERASTSGVLPDPQQLDLFAGRTLEAQVVFENRSIADAVQVRFLASKNDQKRVGCTITRTRAAGPMAGGGGSGRGARLQRYSSCSTCIPSSPGRPR